MGRGGGLQGENETKEQTLKRIRKKKGDLKNKEAELCIYAQVLIEFGGDKNAERAPAIDLVGNLSPQDESYCALSMQNNGLLMGRYVCLAHTNEYYGNFFLINL